MMAEEKDEPRLGCLEMLMAAIVVIVVVTKASYFVVKTIDRLDAIEKKLGMVREFPHKPNRENRE